MIPRVNVNVYDVDKSAAARRAHSELVASRSVDTRPGRGEGPMRPGAQRVARRHA
jgi:hypothetical protein